MKKIVLIYGIISGVIVGGLMFITLPMFESGTFDYDKAHLVGYTTMIIALSLIFFGIKSYRDNQMNGVISFWKAAQVGILIAIVSAVFYAASWEVMYSYKGDAFMARMTTEYFKKLEEKGATADEISKARVEWNEMMDYYKNPVIRFAITMTEILPVGVIITAISAGLLRRKDFLPDTNSQSAVN